MYIQAHMIRAQDEAKIAGSANVETALSTYSNISDTPELKVVRLTLLHCPVVVLRSFRCVQSSPTITSSALVTANSVRSIVLPAKCVGLRTRPLAVS